MAWKAFTGYEQSYSDTEESAIQALKDKLDGIEYVDGNGKQKFLYSWKLENTDRVPQGKRDCVSLRDKIKMLNKDLGDGITPDGGKITVLQLMEKYIGQKTGVRHNTEANYKFMHKLDIKNPIIRISIGFKYYSSTKKATILPRIYHD